MHVRALHLGSLARLAMRVRVAMNALNAALVAPRAAHTAARAAGSQSVRARSAPEKNGVGLKAGGDFEFKTLKVG